MKGFGRQLAHKKLVEVANVSSKYSSSRKVNIATEEFISHKKGLFLAVSFFRTSS